MDFRQAIITFLGLQDVKIIDLKVSKKQRTVVVKVQQRRDSCFCRHCGEQFAEVKDWDLKVLRAPPLGVFQHVTVKFVQLRGRCDNCSRTSVAELDIYARQIGACDFEGGKNRSCGDKHFCLYI